MRLREYCGTREDKTLSSRMPHHSALKCSSMGANPAPGSSSSSRSSISVLGTLSAMFGLSIGFKARPIGYYQLLFKRILAKSHAKTLNEIRRGGAGAGGGGRRGAAGGGGGGGRGRGRRQ